MPRKQGQIGFPIKTGNPVALHDTMKGDHHKDKPFSQYRARNKGDGQWAGMFGGEGSAAVKPAYNKPLSHSHGSKPNKVKVRNAV